ncbi:hypothetical protein ACWGE1_21255 [Streptomyces sp. NPDC054932]
MRLLSESGGLAGAIHHAAVRKFAMQVLRAGLEDVQGLVDRAAEVVSAHLDALDGHAAGDVLG